MTATAFPAISHRPNAQAHTRARGRGRPSKRTPARAARVLEGLRLGLKWEVAAAHADISTTTLSEWRSEDERFAEDCERARVEGEFLALEQIHAASNDNWRAAAWLLERVFPDRYTLNRLELTGAGGGPVQEVCEVVRLSELTVDELRRLSDDTFDEKEA